MESYFPVMIIIQSDLDLWIYNQDHFVLHSSLLDAEFKVEQLPTVALDTTTCEGDLENNVYLVLLVVYKECKRIVAAADELTHPLMEQYLEHNA